MTRILNVYALPSLAAPEELAGGTAVAIDVLRASTTIVHALAAGAREVIPCLEVADARATAAGLPRDQVLLGGERGGLPIEGFDLGNSPQEYTPQRVGGRLVVLTTTNGTRAIVGCRPARRVLVGAFVNAAAVVSRLVEEEAVHLVCAGTAGQVSRDDTLLAGMLVQQIQQRSGLIWRLNAQAITAREGWLAAFSLPEAVGGEPLGAERLAAELRQTEGGRHLVEVGLGDDILTAAQLDRFDLVPELEPGGMRIRGTMNEE